MELGEFRKLIANLPDTCKMYFDSEAACFDCHLVEIASASLVEDEDINDKVIILCYSMKDTPFHFNNK